MNSKTSFGMTPQKKKEAKYEKALCKTYYTPKESASFSGIQRLKQAVKTKGSKIKKKNLIKWLSTHDTLHYINLYNITLQEAEL